MRTDKRIDRQARDKKRSRGGGLNVLGVSEAQNGFIGGKKFQKNKVLHGQMGEDGEV